MARPIHGSSMLSPPATNEADLEQRERLPSMERGVSQLLFNYLPQRTVDWEDGLAVVTLGAVRLSSLWKEERKEVVLSEIQEIFSRWTSRGGTVDEQFEKSRDAGRFTLGAPEAIEAWVLDAALICQRCGQLRFEKRAGRGDQPTACPECNLNYAHNQPPGRRPRSVDAAQG
jgi:hypothetical protein